MKYLYLLAVMAMFLAGCQDPVQPTNVTNTTAHVGVEVRTGSGKPLPTATIDWTKRSGINTGTTGSAITGPDGLATLTFTDLSVARDTYHLAIQPPATAGFAGVPTVQTDVALCSDTNLRFTFDSLRQCGSTDNTDTIEVRYCPTEGNQPLRECRYYPTNCPTPLDVRVTATNDPSVTVAASTTAPEFRVVEVCATVARNPGQTLARDIPVTVTATQRGTAQIRFVANVLLRLLPECSTCACPTGGQNSDTTKPVCVGANANVELHLSKIANPITDPNCRIELILERGFSTQELKLETSSVNVRGGDEFPDVKLSVEPNESRTQSIVDSITYRVRVVQNDGKELECPERIHLKVLVPITRIQCELRPAALQRFNMCVADGNPNTQRMVMKNTGGCPLPWTAGTTSDVFTVSPDRGEVAPGDSVILTVSFMVTADQHRRNPAVATGTDQYKAFSAMLLIEGCNTADIPLNGDARLICEAFKYLCIHQYRAPERPDQFAESIRFPESKVDIEYKNDPNSNEVYDIYVDSAYMSGGQYTVDFATGNDASTGQTYGKFESVASGWSLTPDKNICDTYPANAPTICNSMKNGSGQGMIKGLHTGSVFMYVKEGKCALIWVIEISPDRASTPAVTRVCMEICYPLYTD